MTGLDVENDVIIEIFCIITNGNLDIMDEEGWGAVIHQTKERMDQMVRVLPSHYTHRGWTDGRLSMNGVRRLMARAV
jgi:oligoribonuclease